MPYSPDAPNCDRQKSPIRCDESKSIWDRRMDIKSDLLNVHIIQKSCINLEYRANIKRIVHKSKLSFINP